MEDTKIKKIIIGDAMLSARTGEPLFRGYVSNYYKNRGNICYKLMSKFTKSGDIFYVFYIQDKSGNKDILLADIAYSPSDFQRRLRTIKEAFKIKSFMCARLYDEK